MSESANINEVRLYLAAEFPDARIEVIKEETGDISFAVEAAATTYLLTMVTEYGESRSAAQVAEELPSFCVADTMRSLGEFRVLLTPSGCIFA